MLRPNSGLTRLSFNPIVNYLFAGVRGPLPARLIDGTPIEIDPHDYHGRILWLFGTNDWKVSRTVNALLSPGDVMLDIGANYGTIGLAARHQVGAAGHVHFFEPQPILAARLGAAIRQTGTGNLTLHEVALFDSEGAMELELHEGHSGTATLVGTVGGVRRASTITVPVHSTEAFLGALRDHRRWGVKIDIEGAEMHVLPALFRVRQPEFVVFEGDRNKRELYDFFISSGFLIYGLCRTVFRHQVQRLEEFDDWGRFHDFVAVPNRARLPAVPVSLAALAQALKAGQT